MAQDDKAEKARERAKKYYWDNRDKILAARKGVYSRDNHYWSRFRIRFEEFEERQAKQGGICANPGCSQKAETQRNGVLVVDHNRACCNESTSCGKCVRGLLCQGCNKALGLLYEDRERIMGLVDYLNEWEVQV